MAYFRIDEPNQPTKYIKSVDGANGTLEFTSTTDDAYYKDSGFFADFENGFLMFHFKEAYPELQYMQIDTADRTHRVLNQVQDEPIAEAIAYNGQEEDADAVEGNVWGDIDADAPQPIAAYANAGGIGADIGVANAGAIEIPPPMGVINEMA